MNIVNQAYQIRLKNIQARTGKSLVEPYALIQEMAKRRLIYFITAGR